MLQWKSRGVRSETKSGGKPRRPAAAGADEGGDAVQVCEAMSEALNGALATGLRFNFANSRSRDAGMSAN